MAKSMNENVKETWKSTINNREMVTAAAVVWDVVGVGAVVGGGGGDEEQQFVMMMTQMLKFKYENSIR